MPAYDFDIEAMIEELATAEIAVRNLWYKGASSSCTPPGSSMSMSVMVDAVLINSGIGSDENCVIWVFKERHRLQWDNAPTE